MSFTFMPVQITTSFSMLL